MSKKTYTDYVESAIYYFIHNQNKSEHKNRAWAANFKAVASVYKTLTTEQQDTLSVAFSVKPSEMPHYIGNYAEQNHLDGRAMFQFVRSVERLVAIERGLIEDDMTKAESETQNRT